MPRKGPDWNSFLGISSIFSIKQINNPNIYYPKACKLINPIKKDLVEIKQNMASTNEKL